MNKLFLIFLVLGIGAAKSQELQISAIPFPSGDVPSLIVGMTQDHQGNIWLAASNEGVYKYDGENLKRYANERNNPNSLISDRLECITTDADGFIWIGTFTQGLVRFDPVTETFTNFQHDADDPQSIRSNGIRAIAQDREGGLWIGTLEGLDFYDPKTNIFHHTFSRNTDAEILDKEHIRVLYVDRSGMLWAGSSSPFFGEESQGGLFRVDVHTKEVKRYYHTSEDNSLIDNRVSALFEDSQGNFWVGTAGDGLHIMDRDKGTFTRYPYDPSNPNNLSRPPVKGLNYAADHIRFITEDAEGFIWIGTVCNGINRYDPRNKTMQHLGSESSDRYHLPIDYFWSCLSTRDNLLWISSWTPNASDQILFKVNPTPNEVYHRRLDKFIYCFAEGSNGTIYLGSDNELIQIDSNGHERTLVQINPTIRTELNHLLKDDDGNLWISSGLGLHYFNVKTGALTSYTPESKEAAGLWANEIFVSALLNKDSLLVGTVGGLYLLDLKGKKFIQIKHTDVIVKDQTLNRVQEIYIDSRKNIWVGFRNYTLKKLDLASGTFQDYPFAKNVSDRVFDIYEDESGNLYVANYASGLRQYVPERDRFSLITDHSGWLHQDSEVYGITETEDSTLWLYTNKGLVKYDIPSGTAFLFGKSWGISSARIVSRGLFQSSKGEFYLGTSAGYLKCRPEDFERKSDYTPEPFIAKISVDDQLALLPTDNIRKNIRFSYNQNDINLTLGYVNFLTNPGENELQYKLEPYDEKWRSGKNQEEVAYFKLTPGTYLFRLRAMDIYGEWTEKSLELVIAPPWWKTWWAYLCYGLLALAGIFRFDRYQRRRIIRQERQRTMERELAQAKEIEKAYADLKTTQAQLIQSEKLASLGELTAGIAHEIQNPLNFVNNFAEVSADLVGEMEDELKQGQTEDAIVIAADLKQNLAKIHHHGQRASSIVKSMLQHSRASTGEKEPTDLNALVDECIRLSYHGMRAQDPGFQAKYELELDEQLPEVSVVRQDIGRVLLNLFNNAFYAVNEKYKMNTGGSYQPLVKVSTHRTDAGLEIAVRDNGPGIPETVREKIFQPFFTTKPTGQGTGLGLSLAYDIVVKGHWGQLEVESVEGNGTVFIVRLPGKD